MLIYLFLQNFKTVLQLIKDVFFKHGEKEALRSCVKAVMFCSSDSQGELQDFAHNKLKDIEDELIAKLKSALKAVVVIFTLTVFYFVLGLINKCNMVQICRGVMMNILFL